MRVLAITAREQKGQSMWGSIRGLGLQSHRSLLFPVSSINYP